MFSGKTEELLRRIKRARLARQRVVLFKPRVDNRYDEVKVVSHEGVNADAVPVASAEELLARLPDPLTPPLVVGIDEAQFFDAAIVDAAESLASRGVRVIAAGLDQDWRGRPVRADAGAPGGGRVRHQAPRRLRAMRRRGDALAAPRRGRGAALRGRRGRVRGAMPGVLRGGAAKRD